MPTTLRVETVRTLRQYTTFLEKQLVASADYTLWFRGTGRASYSLAPSLHRHPQTQDPAALLQLETRIIDRFNQRSVPFLTTPINKADDWEVMFFMQHQGIPTRLLDWSENPFIGLYFALTSARFDLVNNKKTYTEDAAVWMLDPVVWNRESLKDFTFQEGILSVKETGFVDSYKPRTAYANMRDKPIAIFGTHNSRRIVAQRGVFTVAGKDIKPMEMLYVEQNFPQDCLIKIVVPAKSIDSLIDSLTSIGITDSVAYPDLTGFSKEIVRFFKFTI